MRSRVYEKQNYEHTNIKKTDLKNKIMQRKKNNAQAARKAEREAKEFKNLCEMFEILPHIARKQGYTLDVMRTLTR